MTFYADVTTMVWDGPKSEELFGPSLPWFGRTPLALLTVVMALGLRSLATSSSSSPTSNSSETSSRNGFSSSYDPSWWPCALLTGFTLCGEFGCTNRISSNQYRRPQSSGKPTPNQPHPTHHPQFLGQHGVISWLLTARHMLYVKIAWHKLWGKIAYYMVLAGMVTAICMVGKQAATGAGAGSGAAVRSDGVSWRVATRSRKLWTLFGAVGVTCGCSAVVFINFHRIASELAGGKEMVQVRTLMCGCGCGCKGYTQIK